MAVRIATPDDAPELVRLRGVMFDAMGVDHSDPGWARACDEVLRRCLADGTMRAYVVDRDGGGLRACGVGMLAQRLPSPRTPNGRHGYVQSMATDEDSRGRGYAREVFEALLAWFEEEGVTNVDLHATAAGAALYRQYGFSEPRHPTLGRH